MMQIRFGVARKLNWRKIFNCQPPKLGSKENPVISLSERKRDDVEVVNAVSEHATFRRS